MTTALPHNKLQVHYRILVPGETARVMVAGATAADTVPEQWQAWRAMTRIQWFPSWLEGEQLEQALLQELRCSHPSAEDVAVAVAVDDAIVAIATASSFVISTEELKNAQAEIS